MTQKILIYGGSGGIGSATGRMLHARGLNSTWLDGMKRG
jgi:NAD(P)-dependent dehydrogenase (short-subunit alcohol dehydrogenase family)